MHEFLRGETSTSRHFALPSKDEMIWGGAGVPCGRLNVSRHPHLPPQWYGTVTILEWRRGLIPKNPASCITGSLASQENKEICSSVSFSGCHCCYREGCSRNMASSKSSMRGNISCNSTSSTIWIGLHAGNLFI